MFLRVLVYTVRMNKVDLTELFNKVFLVKQFDYSINPLFRNIRNDSEEEIKLKKRQYYQTYNLTTKSDRIKK